MGGQQPGHARADDGDVEGDVGSDVVLVPRGGAPVDALGGELLEEQVEVGVDVGVAHDVGGEGAEGLVVHRRLGDAPAPAVAEVTQRRGGEGLALVELFGGEAALRIDEVVGVRPQVLGDEGEVAGDLGQRRQQGAEGRLLDGGVDQGIVGAGEGAGGGLEVGGRADRVQDRAGGAVAVAGHFLSAGCWRASRGSSRRRGRR